MKSCRFNTGDMVKVNHSIYYGPQWDAMNLSNEIRPHDVYKVTETRYIPHMDTFYVGFRGLYSQYPEEVLIKIVKIANDNKGDSYGKEEV